MVLKSINDSSFSILAVAHDCATAMFRYQCSAVWGAKRSILKTTQLPVDAGENIVCCSLKYSQAGSFCCCYRLNLCF